MKILLPNFLLPKQEITTLFDARALPALTALLRGKTCQLPIKSKIWEYLDSEQVSWPGMAPIMLAYDMPHATAGFWLRADPVLLRPSLDNLILFPGASLAITQAEADALVQSLNQLFAENGLTFYAPTPTRWYVHCREMPDVNFTDVEHVLGRQIDGFLPTGTQALLWHRYLNEIQMLFYTHPINEARALAQRQMIPSVWFWGAGHYPFSPSPTKKLRVYSDQEEVCWQAQALAYPSQLFSPEKVEFSPNSAWVIVALSKALAEAGRQGWQRALAYIDQTYLQVALRALKARQVAQIELIFPEETRTYQVTTRRSDTWKFWRASPQTWAEKIS